MQKSWQKLAVGLAVGAASMAIVLGPLVVFGDSYGLDATAKAAKIPNNGNIQTIIGNVIGTALSMISVLFFALMLYAGIKWMLARGDSDEAKKALDTIVAAIIGMLVVLGSYAITNFVFGTLGGGTTPTTQTPVAPDGGAAGSCKPKVDTTAVCGIYGNDETICLANPNDYCAFVGGTCTSRTIVCSTLYQNFCGQGDYTFCEWK